MRLLDLYFFYYRIHFRRYYSLLLRLQQSLAEKSVAEKVVTEKAAAEMAAAEKAAAVKAAAEEAAAEKGFPPLLRSVCSGWKNHLGGLKGGAPPPTYKPKKVRPEQRG